MRETIGRCDRCQGLIIWARTVNNKPLALDPQPNPKGNQASYRDGTQTRRTRQLKADEEPLGFERRHMPHVATCALVERQPAPVAPLPSNVIPISRAQRRRNPSSPAPRRGA